MTDVEFDRRWTFAESAGRAYADAVPFAEHARDPDGYRLARAALAAGVNPEFTEAFMDAARERWRGLR